MNFDKEISALLFEHDCVIIPNFGGFVCNYASATVHSVKHRFRPPHKKISFNLNLKNNDGLLANHIVQSRKISYTEAIRLINGYVELVQGELIQKKRFIFKNIGTVYLGEENNLLFEQDEVINYLPEAFGFSTFNASAIRRESLERKTENDFKDKTVIPPREATPPVRTRRKLSPYLLGSAAVLILMFLFWIPFQSGLITHADYSDLNPFASKEQPLYQPSGNNIPLIDNTRNLVQADSNLFTSVSDTIRYLNTVIAKKVPVVVRLKEDDVVVAKTQKKKSSSVYHFHIVGGAFGVSANAEKFYNKLIQEGHQASIIEKDNLRIVSYGEFETKEQALEALDKIRAIQKDAWLMTN